MAEKSSERKAKLRESIDALISGVEESGFLSEGGDPAPRPSSPDSLEPTTPADIDGRVELSLSGDEMRCLADFYPPSGQGALLAQEELYDLFSDKGVVHGIDWKALEEAIFKCNTEREVLSEVVIAKGSKPTPSIPSRIAVKRGLLEGQKRVDSSTKGNIDFRKQSPFTMVSKGDRIAKILSPRKGRPGKSVTGKEVPPPTLKKENYIPAENTLRGEQYIVAACDGRFVCEDNRFWVSKVLEIESNVGYGTGNIEFAGDVVLGGEVRDRFTISCDGSLFCKTTLDAYEVKVGGDIVVDGGIIGRKEGVVEAGGSVKAKFVENCFVKAAGEIMIKTGIINSHISTLENVRMGLRGTIIGGRIVAQNGVEAAQIGSPSASHAEILCGIDYTVQEKLVWIRENSIKLAEKLYEIDRELKREEDPKLQELADRVRAKISVLNEQAGELVDKLDRNEDARVVVRGTIYPGNHVEIGHASFVVDKARHAVGFILSKQQGRVEAQPLFLRSTKE